MAIKRFVMRNLQAHRGESIIELPEKGLVRLCGNNSDGKSVLPKTLFALVSGSVRSPAVRKSLINYEETWAQLLVERYDGRYLLLHIEKEASATFLEYKYEEDAMPIRRYIANKGWEDIVAEFGFHFDKRHGISLNIYNTYDPLLLVTTSGKLNLDVIEAATVDENVANAIVNMKETLKDLRGREKSINEQLTTYRAILSQLVHYNVTKEQLVIRDALALASELKALSFICQPPKIPYFDFNDLLILSQLPDVEATLASIGDIDDNLVNDLVVLFGLRKITNLTEDIRELHNIEDSLSKNVCPMCNKSLLEGVHTHEN